MDLVYEQNLLPRVLMSIVALMLIVGPAKADFNETHATNPLWPPHARFHVVWQVLYNACVSCITLYLLWQASADYATHLYLAAVLNFCWGLNFYLTIFAMPLFGGALKDVNGIKPFRFNFGDRHIEVDTNLFGGTFLMLLNLSALLLIEA